MALAFDQPSDRRFVARELFEALRADDAAIANAGALARLHVPGATLDRLPPGSVLAQRRQRYLASLSRPPHAKPRLSVDTPLLTAADLTAHQAGPDRPYRPGISVRRWMERTAVSRVVRCGRPHRPVSSRPGEPLLIGAVLLLSTLGFVVMLGRPDPLRDTMLVVRYTQGVVVGVIAFPGGVDHSRAGDEPSGAELSAAGRGVMALSLLSIGLGTGSGGSSARINLGPVQPMELICFARTGSARPLCAPANCCASSAARPFVVIVCLRGWNVPRPHHVLPVVAAVGVALGMFFVLRNSSDRRCCSR